MRLDSIDWGAVIDAARQFLVDLDPRLAAVAVVLAPLVWRVVRRLRREPGYLMPMCRGIVRHPVAAILFGLPLLVLDILTLPIGLVGSLRVKPAEVPGAKGLRDAIAAVGHAVGETAGRVEALEASLGIRAAKTDRIEVVVPKSKTAVKPA